MAKKKNATALFEAISKTREKASFATPNWIGGQDAKANAGSAQAGSASPTRIVEAASGGDGRIVFALNQVGIATAIAVLIAVMGVAFWAGRATAPGKPAGEDAPATAGNVPAENAPGQAEEEPVAELPKRVVGKYYLIIETTKGDSDVHKQDALKMAQWLWKEKKQPCEARTITVSGKTVWGVWSLKAFDRAADGYEYAKKINDELGPEYFKVSRKYKFNQYLRGSFNPWIIQATEVNVK